jgi:hypothetical protein
LPLQKPLTPTKRDKLNTLVNACAAAPVGARSEADWRLVCTAIEKGWPKSDVWEAVLNVGKFAEGGEAYFERTWSRAELHARERHFDQADNSHKKGKGQSKAARSEPGSDGKSDPGLVVKIAERICERERFAQDEGGKLYRYRGGVYQVRAEAFVKAKLPSLPRSSK